VIKKKKDEIGTIFACVGIRERHTESWLGNMKKRNPLGTPRQRLEDILKNWMGWCGAGSSGLG
jgi:hypothetical protein